MATCKSCGNVVGASAWKCAQCGSETATATMIWGKIAVIVFVLGFILWFLANLR